MEMQQTDAEAPPVYDTAIKADSADSPPSYESLTIINKLRKAKDESSNPVEYVMGACSIICGSMIITVLFAISIVMPITMIVIGAIYIDECNIQKNIPMWLIVAGTFGCLSSILRTATNCYSLFKKRSTDEQHEIGKKGCLSSLIDLFLFAWFIAGNVWVYSIYKTVQYDPANMEFYCHKTCYLFSFWIITISWIMTGFLCCCCCCILVVVGCGIGIAGAAK